MKPGAPDVAQEAISMPVRCDEALHLLQPMLEQGQAPCAERHRAGLEAGAGKILWLLPYLPHRELHSQLGRQKRSRHSIDHAHT